METVRIGPYRIRVDGDKCTVYRGRKLIGAWFISVPLYEIQLGIDSPQSRAETAARVAAELEASHG